MVRAGWMAAHLRWSDGPRQLGRDRMAALAPREMRRAWMTAFGNARLDRRGTVEVRDLPDAGSRRQPIGFTH